MKNILCMLLLFCTVFSFSSCCEQSTADELMESFLSAYGAEGVVYSPSRGEGELGYIDGELFHKIYVLDGEIPFDFAIFLNSHTDKTSECGIFICEDAAERMEIEKMCLERIKLLGADSSFISRSGNVVFYSTMSDKEKSESIWRSVIAKS